MLHGDIMDVYYTSIVYMLVMYAFCFSYECNVVMFLITGTFRGLAVIRDMAYIGRWPLF